MGEVGADSKRGGQEGEVITEEKRYGGIIGERW